jgi:hypothetical protein
MALLVVIALKNDSRTPFTSDSVVTLGTLNPIGDKLSHARDFVYAGVPKTLMALLEGEFSQSMTFKITDQESVHYELVDLNKFNNIQAKLLVLTFEGVSRLTAKQLTQLPLLWKESDPILERFGLNDFDKLEFSRALVIQNEFPKATEGLTRFVDFKPFDFQSRGRAVAITVAAQSVAVGTLMDQAVPNNWNIIKKWTYASQVTRVERDIWWENLFESHNAPTLYSDLQSAYGLPSRVKQLFEYAKTLRSEVTVTLTVLNAFLLLVISILTIISD